MAKENKKENSEENKETQAQETENTETQETEGKEELGELTQADVDDIDNAVDATMETIEKERKEDENTEEDKDKKEEKPEEENTETEETETEEEEQEDTTSPDPNKEAAEDKEVSDEQLTKAVGLGISIAEAKALGPELLENMISRLEKDNKKEESEENNEEEDLMKGIPDLDPEDYDEEIVNGFKTLKEIIGQQQKTIKELQTGNSKESEENWYESQVAGLGEDISKVLKDAPVKAQQLKEKYEVFSAGYKAAGKKVDKETIFKEAVNTVLSKEISESTANKKEADLKKRSKQHLNRPTARKGKMTGDVFEDTANEIDRKFFKD